MTVAPPMAAATANPPAPAKSIVRFPIMLPQEPTRAEGGGQSQPGHGAVTPIWYIRSSCPPVGQERSSDHGLPEVDVIRVATRGRASGVIRPAGLGRPAGGAAPGWEAYPASVRPPRP